MPFSPPSPDTLIEDQPQASFQPPSPDSLILPKNAFGENAEDLKTAMARVRRERIGGDIAEGLLSGAEAGTKAVAGMSPVQAVSNAGTALGLQSPIPKEHFRQALDYAETIAGQPSTGSEFDEALKSGAKDFISETASGLTRPDQLALLAASGKFPTEVGRAFQLAPIPELPQQISQVSEDIKKGDVSGATKSGMSAALGAALPFVIEHGINTSVPPLKIPDFPGESLPTPEGAKPPAKPADALFGKPEVPFSPPEPQRDIPYVREIRQAGAKTKEEIRKLYPQISREDAARIRDEAWPEDALARKQKEAAIPPLNERIDNALQRETAEAIPPLRERPVESVQQVPAESPGEEVGSGSGAAEEKGQVTTPLKVGEVPTPHDLHGATLEQFMAYHDALKGPGAQRAALNEFGKSLSEEGIKEAERLAQLSREKAGQIIKGEGDLDTKFRQSMEENQRTQFLDEGARTAKARKAVSEGMDAAEAIKKFGVPPSAVEDMAKAPEAAAEPKAPEVNFGIWPESEWSAASLAKQTPGERIGKAKFLGLRDKEGQLILGPKTLADAAAKRIAQIKADAAKPKPAPAPEPAAEPAPEPVSIPEPSNEVAKTDIPPEAPKQALPKVGEPLLDVKPSTRKSLQTLRSQIVKRLEELTDIDPVTGELTIKEDRPDEEYTTIHVKKLKEKLKEVETKLMHGEDVVSAAAAKREAAAAKEAIPEAKPVVPETKPAIPETKPGTPADEFGAINGPKLSADQVARFKEQEGQEFQLDSPEGTTTTLKVKPSMLWVETSKKVPGSASQYDVGISYLKIRADGTTVLDASHHGRPIDKLAADSLANFLRDTQGVREKAAKVPEPKQLSATKAAEPATKAAELPSSGNEPAPSVISKPTKESNHIVIAENGTLKLQKKALNGEAVDIGQIAVDKFGKNATAQNKAIRQLLGEGKHSSAIVSDIRVAANEALKESADVAKSVENQREAEIKANALRLHIIPPVPDWLANIAKSAGRALYRARKAFPTIVDSRQARHWMDQSRDAADNLADIAAQQMGKRIKTGHTDIEDRAASAMIAGKFDPAEFPGLIAKAIRGGNLEARQALEYALGHWTEVEPMARAGERIFENQLADENAAGINTEYHEGYLPGVYDEDLWMGAGRPFVIGGRSSGGVSTGFKKGKTYATPYDAISDGYVPKTLKLSDLVENRVKRGQRLINRKAWANALRSIVDPTDHKPIVEDLQYVSRGPGLPGFEKAPIGYVAREIIPGTRIAVRENYAKLFDALTGRSVIAEFEPGGIPVGTMALEGAGGIKHGLLVFDSFHAGRILQKELFLTGNVGYRKGQSLLEYADADLAAAVRAGDIKPEWAAWARANRPTANLLIKAGLNVGRIQEGMYNSLVRDVPVIGSFNKWVFEKMTRGAMLQSGLLEFERVRNANPGWSDEQVAAKVARDLNKYFGNLGRQGVFKSPSFQDAARLVALAPNWVESMARSELGGVKQLTYDPVMNRSLHIGSLGRGLAQGLAAYFVGTQLLNLATRGHLTWQNPEEGHKWDAWVPDIAGRSGGYFLSPMGVVAELTHDMIKYSKTEPNVLAAAWRIMRNRSSPFFRAGRILLGGRDWDDSKINDVWDRVKKAAVAVLPTPIPLQTVGKTVKPGQVQRQVVSSLGFKLDTAETPRVQIMNQGRAWALNNADPKIKAAAEREQTGDRSDSVYKPLRLALSKNDRQGIIDEVRAIVQLEPKERQAERLKEVLKNVDPFSSNGIKPFATPIHSKAAEVAFVKSLDANGKAAYKKAVKDAIMDFRRVTEAIYGRPRNPEVPPGYESFLK